MPLRKELRKVQEEAAQLAAEDPLVISTHGILTKWSDRAVVNGRMLLQVQQLLTVLATQLEGCRTELADVYADAALLSSLRLAEYRRKTNPLPTQTTSGRKQKPNKRDGSFKVASKPVDENSAEALIAAMDEKKRQKVSAALVSYFKRHSDVNLLPISPSPPSPPPASGKTFSSSPNQMNEIANRQLALSMVSESMSTCTNADRRPKDVPVDLWTDITRLRFRRLTLDGRIEVLTNDLEAQLRRFDLLAQNYSIASYTKESADRTLVALKRSKGVLQ